MEPLISVDEAIAILNRIHASDPSVLPTMVAHRVPCNEALAKDPTVQVGKTDLGYEVGLLGVLNGLFGIGDDGYGHISAVYFEGRLLRFEKVMHGEPVAEVEEHSSIPADYAESAE